MEKKICLSVQEVFRAAMAFLLASVLMQNRGKGVFSEVTKKLAPEMENQGMVTDAEWVDIDKDGASQGTFIV